MEELRLGEVELRYDCVWMPLASTSRNIAKEAKLMKEQKCYEANLAHKAIIESLSRDSVIIGLGTDEGGRLSTTLSYSAMQRENSQDHSPFGASVFRKSDR